MDTHTDNTLANTGESATANAGEGKYDFAAAEIDYRGGGYSVNALAVKYGIPETTMRRHIKSNGWVRGNVEAKRKLVRETMAGLHDDAGEGGEEGDGLGMEDAPASTLAIRQAQVDAVVQDVQDMQKGLKVARKCMDKLLRMVSLVDHPKEVKMICEANKLAVETIRKIRSLDEESTPEEVVANAVSDGFDALRDAFRRRLATPYQPVQPVPEQVAGAVVERSPTVPVGTGTVSELVA